VNSLGGFVAAKILLVDDDADRRESVRAVLKSSEQFEVQAVDCEKSMSLLASDRFDLIVLDVTLPQRGGFRVLEFLRQNHLAGKVIVITGTVEVENAIKTASPGAGDYLVKPYNPRYLLMSIEHVLSDLIPRNLKLQIVKAGDFIKSTPTGDLDLEASTQGLAQIAAAGTELGEYKVLIDLRDVKSKLSTSDVFELGYNLVKYGETFRRKTAVLARPDEDAKQAKFFESVAQTRGFTVRAFTDFEEAMTWLSTVTQLTEDHLQKRRTSEQ
jgi:DNA-binding response OmpR family regulator